MLFRLVAEGVDAHLRAGGIKNPDHHFLAPQGRQGVDPEVDGFALGQAHLDPPVLGLAAFGDVEAGHDLQPRGDSIGQLDRRLGDFPQHAVGAHPHAIDFLVGLEMQVGRTAPDRVEQHFMDEAHHRRVIGILADDGVLTLVIDGLDVQAFEVDIGHVFQAGPMGVEELLDGVAELVVLHEDGFGRKPGTELDVVDGLVIGRVGNPHEQFVASAPEGQRVVLADQFLADQALGLNLRVQGMKVQQGHAEMLRGDLGDLAAFDQFVLNQIADQGDAVALGLLGRLLRAFVSEQLGQDQLLGQAAEGDVIHWDTGRRQFMTYSLVKQWSQTSGSEVTKSVR
ncbi:hypothetical protein D3C86_1133390 [compost metagenome]